jgi:glucose dehydrogenase
MRRRRCSFLAWRKDTSNAAEELRGGYRAISPYNKEDAMRVVSTFLLAAALAASATAAFAQDIDWQKVDDAFGRKAAVVAGDVHRYGFPRTDLTVTLDGVTIKPALALGG